MLAVCSPAAIVISQSKPNYAILETIHMAGLGPEYIYLLGVWSCA